MFLDILYIITDLLYVTTDKFESAELSYHQFSDFQYFVKASEIYENRVYIFRRPVLTNKNALSDQRLSVIAIF